MFIEFKFEDIQYEYREKEFLRDGLFYLDENEKSFKLLTVVDLDLQNIIDTKKQEFLNTEYQELRKKEYDKLNQFEMMYDDKINNTNTWGEAVEQIKAKYPKPNGV